MDNNFPRHHRRLAVAAVVAVATVGLIAGVLSTGAASAGESRSLSTCLAKAGTGIVSVGAAGGSTALTDALAETTTPTIYVGGICKGNFTIARDVTVIGGLRTKGSLSEDGKAILDAQGAGTVVVVNDPFVTTLSRLTIRNATTNLGGAGILNMGNLALTLSTVSANTASNHDGGGIYSTHTLTVATGWTGTTCGNTPDDFEAEVGTITGQAARRCSA